MRSSRMVLTLLGAAALVEARRRLVVVTVSGTSMTPAFRPGDRVLVLRRWRAGRLRPGMVVVIEGRRDGAGWDRPPLSGRRVDGRLWAIKRVAAVPGDEVPDPVRAAVGGRERVPPRSVVVLGDAPQSADSRQWGFCPVDRVLGVVARRLPAAAAVSS